MKKIVLLLLTLTISSAANGSQCAELIDKMVDTTELKNVLHCLDQANNTHNTDQNSKLSVSPAAKQPNASTKTDSDQPTVKKSKSGICHGKGSKYYDQTQRYTSFDTIQACLDSGGRLPKK